MKCIKCNKKLLLVLYVNCSHPRCICSPNSCMMCKYFNDIAPKYNSENIWLYSGYGGKWWVNDPKNNETINKIYTHDIKRKEKASDDDVDDFSIEVKKTGKRQRTINNSSIDITSFKPVVINNKTSFAFKSVNTNTDKSTDTDTEDSDEIIVNITDDENNDAIEYVIFVDMRSYVIDFINMQQYDIIHPERKRNIKKMMIDKDDKNDIITLLKQDNSIRGINGIPFSK